MPGMTAYAAAAGQKDDSRGLSATDWSSIQAAYEASRHAVFAVEGDYQARNMVQRWQTRFDGRGFVTTPDAGGWSWGLEVIGYGRNGIERTVSGVAGVMAEGSRVSYQWDETLTEWYVNDVRGLEHGFTLQQRPGAAPEQILPHSILTPTRSAQNCVNGPLVITLGVQGSLRPQISADGHSAQFVNAAGTAVVNYSGLKVVDAEGAAVPAWFEPVRDGLRLIVDDRTARYPLTIDPVAQQAYLKASNTGLQDYFGYSVAISGDTAVIGAPLEDSNSTGVNGSQSDNSSTDSGAAYVFVRNGTTWSQQAYIKASNSGAGDYFGYSVAVSGDVIAIGAPFEDSSAAGVNGNQADERASDSGAVYTFVRDGTSWSQQAYLKSSNTDPNDWFGFAVSVSDDTVVIGAPNEDSNATGVDGNQADNTAADSGAAYVFVCNITTWNQEAYLKAANNGAFNWFGRSVAASNSTIVVGSAGENSSVGAAYVFGRNGTVWSPQAYLRASNAGVSDLFGWSVAVTGDTVVVGAPQEASAATGVNGDQANNSAPYSGAAYIFVRNGIAWGQQAYLKASNTGANDYFGWSVAVSDDTAVIGAYGEASGATGINNSQTSESASNSGAVYGFIRKGLVWNQKAYIKPSNTGAGDRFGSAVSLSADTAVVGAYLEDSNATGINGNGNGNSLQDAGAAYVIIGVSSPCPADVDYDSDVDLADISIVLAYFGATGMGHSYGDLDGNGITELDDLALVLAHYGEHCN